MFLEHQQMFHWLSPYFHFQTDHTLLKTSFASVINMHVFFIGGRNLNYINKIYTIRATLLFAHKDLEVWWLCV